MFFPSDTFLDPSCTKLGHPCLLFDRLTYFFLFAVCERERGTGSAGASYPYQSKAKLGFKGLRFGLPRRVERLANGKVFFKKAFRFIKRL